MNTTIKLSRPDVMHLLQATDAELESLLGMNAISLVQSPALTLANGRSGNYWEVGPRELGDKERSFDFPAFRRIGQEFLQKWRHELQQVICGNAEAYQDIKEKGATELHIVVGTIVGALAAQLPILAPFTGLLIVLGVIIVRTGVDAFCKQLEDSAEAEDAQGA